MRFRLFFLLFLFLFFLNECVPFLHNASLVENGSGKFIATQLMQLFHFVGKLTSSSLISDEQNQCFFLIEWYHFPLAVYSVWTRQTIILEPYQRAFGFITSRI